MKELIPPINTHDGAFVDGNELTGVRGTIVSAEWLNNVQGATRSTQAEILTVLESAGVSVDPDKKDQLLSSINKIINRTGVAYSEVSLLSVSAMTTGHFGGRFWVDYDCPSSFTLPDISDINSDGQTITVWNVKDVNITISVGRSSDNISIPMSTVKSLILKPTESATFIVEQNGAWHATGDGVLKHSLMFAASLALNGWKREPSGLLTQWGSGTPVSGRCHVSFPIVFVNRPFNVIFGFRDAYYPSYAQSIVIEDASLNNLGFICRCMNASTPVVDSPSAFFWRAEGV